MSSATVNRNAVSRRFSRKSISKIQRASIWEPLEARQMMSASVAGTGNELLGNAVSLGSLQLHSHALSAKGSTGGASANAVYSFDVTSPITLNVTVGSLKQDDTVTLFFPNGSAITSQSNGTKGSVHFKQSLNTGTYFLDVNHGDVAVNDCVSATKNFKHRKQPKNLYNFNLNLSAAKAAKGVTAPQEEAVFAGFGASNGIVEPLLNAKDTPQGAHYQDFTSSPLFSAAGPSPDDIEQGLCGDCYFLSTLSDIARSDPGLIEQDIQSIGNGQYKVQFISNGQDVFVTEDAQLPVDTSGNLCFDSQGAGGSIWVCLMEKAFCYFRNPKDISYKAIEQGTSDEVLNDFGATDVATATTYSEQGTTNLPTPSSLANQISTWQQQGRAVLLGTYGEGYTSTLVGGHAYSVVGIAANGDIELRNPWGVNPVDPNDPNSKILQDGGYITLDPKTVYNDTGVLWSGILPEVTPAPTPTPTPTPTPDQTGSVTGTVFQDTNDDQKFDNGDHVLSGWTVYATTDSSGNFVAGDPSAVTDSDGNYTITGLTPGQTYSVFEVIKSGWSDSSGAGFYYTVNDAAGETSTSADFGEIQSTPTPSQNQTLNLTPTDFTDMTQVNATLGNNASTLTDGTMTDVYVITGISNSPTNIMVSSFDFSPEIEVVDFDSAGNVQSVTTSSGNYSALVSFQATKGDQYEVLIGSGDGNTGDYTWTYFNTDLNTPEQLAPDYFSGASNSIITAPGINPISGTIFAGLPDTFGDTPVSPNVGPTPDGPTLNISPTQDTDVTLVNGNMGPNASMLDDGTVVDVYVTTALASTNTKIAVSSPSADADAQIEVIDFDQNGDVVNVVTATSSGSQAALVSFPVTKGDQYEILVANTDNATGAYGMAYFNTDLATPEQLTPEYFTAGDQSGIITAPNTQPIPGNIFADLPMNFGDTPNSQPSLTVLNEDLGVDSFTLNSGTIVDAYTATATQSGYVTVGVNTQNFVSEFEVIEFAPDGTQTDYWINTNNSNGGTLSFQASAGFTYEIVVGSKDGATGNYTLSYDSSTLSVPIQILPF